MRPFAFAVAAALVISAAPLAHADHKGKITWVESYEAGMQKARMTGKPTMLFFTADWWGPCKSLAGSAFSDAGVVEASKSIVPILIDCSKSTPPELKAKYGVSGFPTVLFTKSDGETIERLKSRDPGGVKAQIESIAEQHGVKLFLDLEFGEAKAQAAEQKKLLAVCFTDASPKTTPKNEMLAGALLQEGLKELRGKFLFIELPLKDGKKTTPAAKLHGASKSPTLVILDPLSEEEGKKAVLKKITKPKGLKKNLEKALKEFAKKHG